MREDVTEQKIFHTRHPTRKKFCGGRPGSPLFCDINGNKKLFGLRSYQSRACGSEQGWWNPAPVVKFIADNTDYKDPSTGGSTKPSAKPQIKTTTKSAKSTNKPSTVKTTGSSKSTQNHLENQISKNDKMEILTMRWSKTNKTTTDPSCDAFCQHKYQMCTFVDVDPPLYGCQVIDHARYIGRYAPPGAGSSTVDGVKPSYSGSNVPQDQTSKDSAAGHKLSFEGGTEKTWTAKTYKTATPSCSDYCDGNGQRCTFVNLNPLTYGCKAKLGSSPTKPKARPTDGTTGSSNDSTTPGAGDKTWTKESYKTAYPNCNDYCAKKDMRCSFVNLKPLTYGCKEKFGSSESASKPSKKTATQSTSNPSTSMKPSTLKNKGRQTFQKFTDCSKECSKYKLKCARADGKWQCEQAKKELTKETKSEQLPSNSNGTKLTWIGKEIGGCFKTCKASGKKCTRMENNDSSIRKFHCSTSATSSGSLSRSKPQPESKPAYSTSAIKSTTKPTSSAAKSLSKTKPGTTATTSTTASAGDSGSRSTTGDRKWTKSSPANKNSAESSKHSPSASWEGKAIGDCFKICKASGNKCTRMKTGDPAVRKYHCSDGSFTTPSKKAPKTAKGNSATKSSKTSPSKSSKLPKSGSKSIWEGKKIGDCFKSCKLSGKKCVRMKTGNPDVRKFHCIDRTQTSMTKSPGPAVTSASSTSKPATKPSTTTESLSRSTQDKTWTRDNYRTAEPNCNDYCTKKNMRCTFVNLKPITYGCKAKFGSSQLKNSSKRSTKSKYEGKTWTIKDYKTADPTCKVYCTEKDKKCSLVIFRPKVLYGCK